MFANKISERARTLFALFSGAGFFFGRASSTTSLLSLLSLLSLVTGAIRLFAEGWGVYGGC